MARASLDGLKPPTARSLALQLRLPQQRVGEIIHVLIVGGLIRLEKGSLLPARDVSTLTLADISAAVGGTARVVKRDRPSSTGHFESVARLFSTADEGTIEKLKGISWRDLVQTPADKVEKP